jgi:PAS domain S-box-containing protein
VTATPSPASSPTAVPRRVWVFVVVGGCLAAAVAGLTLPGAARQLAGSSWRDLLVPVVYAAGLVVAERLAVNVPVRNHRLVASTTDMVVVLGVVFIDLPVLVVATAIGIAVSQVLVESSTIKRIFNVVQYVLSVGAAAALTGAVLQLVDRWQPFGLTAGQDQAFRPSLAFAWIIGMVGFFLVNSTMVTAVVSLSVGQRITQPWRRVASVAAVDWAAGTAFGLLIAALLAHDRGLLPLLIIPIGLTLVGNRAWARILAQGQRMHSLYEAGRALSNGIGETDAWREFVGNVSEVLNCDGAAVFLGRPDDGALDVISTQGGPDRLTVAASPSAWERATKGYVTRSRWPRAATVVMETEGKVVGYAVAYGPRVESDFTSEDRETLLTLANQGAAALRNESLYRQAESERATLRDIVGHSTDGIYTVGPDRAVRSWNPAMVALTGYSVEEAIGQKCFNLLRARDGEGVDMCAADCPILAAAKSGQEEVRDASVLNKDGVARWIRYAHAPIMGSDGEMDSDVVVVRDVTRERQTDELKADFVASVSHELRTPLTPIKGFLMTLLREDRDFTQDRRHEYYKLMLVQAQRLERLIEDLLEVTRLETGAGLVDSTPIDAIDLVRQVVDRFTSEDPERVVTVIAPDHAVYCRGDWMRTDQVLANLLSNALRYSPAHEPVEVRLLPQGREVVFEVRDSGPGISLDEQSRIFERFQRGGHYLTREQGGAGLGLYLAKRLVEAMGGRIWVSSRLGSGSVFGFALPAEASLHVVTPRERSIG